MATLAGTMPGAIKKLFLNQERSWRWARFSPNDLGLLGEIYCRIISVYSNPATPFSIVYFGVRAQKTYCFHYLGGVFLLDQWTTVTESVYLCGSVSATHLQEETFQALLSCLTCVDKIQASRTFCSGSIQSDEALPTLKAYHPPRLLGTRDVFRVLGDLGYDTLFDAEEVYGVSAPRPRARSWWSNC